MVSGTGVEQGVLLTLAFLDLCGFVLRDVAALVVWKKMVFAFFSNPNFKVCLWSFSLTKNPAFIVVLKQRPRSMIDLIKNIK